MRMIWPALLLALGGCRGCGEKSEFPDVRNAPKRVLELVEEGDYWFVKAMRHLRNSDPNLNPKGWAAENLRALEYFKRASDEGYSPALDEYPYPASPPQELLDRVRETMLRTALCRKRRVSARQ